MYSLHTLIPRKKIRDFERAIQSNPFNFFFKFGNLIVKDMM